MVRKPEILAKAAFNKEQMDAKMEAGCDGIELQLLKESFVERPGNRWKSFKSVYDIDGLKDYPVKAIHSPLFKGYGDITIETMMNNNDILVLQEMFRLAEMYAERQNIDYVTLVIHSEQLIDTMYDVGGIYNKIRSTFNLLFEQYDHVRVGIENVTPIRSIEDGIISLCNNYRFDNVVITKKLREELKTDRVGTILDTCHAMISKQYIDMIHSMLEDVEADDLSLNNYFEANKDTIYHLHFCDMKGCGFGKGKHGIPFNSETKDRAKEIIELYNRYNYKCPLCLEVDETDFVKCTGYRETKQIINEIYKES